MDPARTAGQDGGSDGLEDPSHKAKPALSGASAATPGIGTMSLRQLLDRDQSCSRRSSPKPTSDTEGVYLVEVEQDSGTRSPLDHACARSARTKPQLISSTIEPDGNIEELLPRQLPPTPKTSEPHMRGRRATQQRPLRPDVFSPKSSLPDNP